jgi:C-terminal processing protease CtpA/Prc
MSRHEAYTSAMFKNYLLKNAGEVIEQTERRTTKPGKNELRYTGKLCVLTGPNTFSSANMLANAIKDYKLATIIGEATGESPNDYGELYWNQLPNTGLKYFTCTKQYIRANGDADDPSPVLPDIEVKQNSKSLKDDVLEFAKEWVKKN